MSKMKRNTEENNISGDREHRKFNLFLVKHGNHSFQNNRGTGNPLGRASLSRQDERK